MNKDSSEESLIKLLEEVEGLSSEAQQLSQTKIDEFEMKQRKYLYFRRLLTVAYNARMEFWIAEFKIDIKGWTVHNNLQTLRKRQDKTCVEFAYRMRVLAWSGKIDDLSLIEHIVGGLGNVWFVKLSSIETQYFAELRNKLQAYDQSKALEINLVSSSQLKEQKLSQSGPAQVF